MDRWDHCKCGYRIFWDSEAVTVTCKSCKTVYTVECDYVPEYWLQEKQGRPYTTDPK